MKTVIRSADVRVLVLGEPGAAHRRADELRMNGFAAWVASDERDLRWLLDEAMVRPSVALVALGAPRDDRAELIGGVSSLMATARLPAVVLGEVGEELADLHGAFARLPADADVYRIVRIMARHP